MNLGELRQAFRREANDIAEPFLWSDENVNSWINEANQEAVRRVRRILRKNAAIPVSAGQRVVAYDKSWFEIWHAELVSGSYPHHLHQVDEFEMTRMRPDWMIDRGVPRQFFVRDGDLTFDKELTQDMTLNIVYSYLPAPLVQDTDEPEMPDVHHRYLIDWALFRSFEVPDKEVFDPQRSAVCRQRFVHYFGRDPVSEFRRAQSANNPHHNKCWW